MLRIILSCTISLLFTTVHATVYKIINDDGSVHYSDKADHKAKVIAPQILHTYQPELPSKTAPPPAHTSNDAPLSKTPKPATAKRYRQFAIISPTDSIIRSNSESITLQLAIKPVLQTQYGHRISIILDGKRLPQFWSSHRITINNITPGTHTLHIILVDKTNRPLAKRSRTITLLRNIIRKK